MVRGANVAQLHNGRCEDESWLWEMGMSFQMSFCRIHLCRGFAQDIIMEKTQLGIAPHGTIHVVLTVEVVLSTIQAEGHVVDIDS